MPRSHSHRRGRRDNHAEISHGKKRNIRFLPLHLQSRSCTPVNTPSSTAAQSPFPPFAFSVANRVLSYTCFLMSSPSSDRGAASRPFPTTPMPQSYKPADEFREVSKREQHDRASTALVSVEPSPVFPSQRWSRRYTLPVSTAPKHPSPKVESARPIFKLPRDYGDNPMTIAVAAANTLIVSSETST